MVSDTFNVSLVSIHIYLIKAITHLHLSGTHLISDRPFKGSLVEGGVGAIVKIRITVTDSGNEVPVKVREEGVN